MAYILYRWREWSSPDEVETWVCTQRRHMLFVNDEHPRVSLTILSTLFQRREFHRKNEAGALPHALRNRLSTARRVGILFQAPERDPHRSHRRLDLEDPTATMREVISDIEERGDECSCVFHVDCRLVVALVLALLAVSGAGLGWATENTWLRATGLLLAGASVLLLALFAAGSRVADAIAAALAARAEARTKTLHELKQELSRDLARMSTPLVVVMDDVDRLSESEIRLLFQLVKANADFPNVVYLLLFQRDIIEQSLVLTPGGSGREFLDKIVQVGFDIPAVERTRLEKVLTSSLHDLLGDTAVGERFSLEHWARLFVPGLRPYFRNLRDVRRFLATLSFHVGVFRRDESFDVNPVDLIGLEVLRVFEPDVYQALPAAKSYLTETERGGGILGGDRAAEEQKRNVEELLARAPFGRQAQVREVLTGLFPPIAWVFGGARCAEGLGDEWQRQLRVCHPDVFDRYFHFAIPLGDVSQAEIDRVLRLAGDRAAY